MYLDHLFYKKTPPGVLYTVHNTENEAACQQKTPMMGSFVLFSLHQKI